MAVKLLIGVITANRSKLGVITAYWSNYCKLLQITDAKNKIRLKIALAIKKNTRSNSYFIKKRLLRAS